jgi:hypothetical protein
LAKSQKNSQKSRENAIFSKILEKKLAPANFFLKIFRKIRQKLTQRVNFSEKNHQKVWQNATLLGFFSHFLAENQPKNYKNNKKIA